jgi:hypothetical protein
LLVFTRADRSATIEIEDSGLFSGSLALMTVGLVGSAGGAPAGAGVVVQPLGWRTSPLIELRLRQTTPNQEKWQSGRMYLTRNQPISF